MIRRTLALGSVTLIGAAAFAVSGVTHVAAGYTSDCGTISGATPVAGGVYVVTTPGRTGTATAAAGVCVNNVHSGGVAPEGGDLEAGVSPTAGAGGGPGVYAVLDGADNNDMIPPVGPIPTSVLQGYAGISNYETATANDGENCNCAGGSNSGGAVGVKGVVTLPVPLIVCGDTSGPDWDSNSRDGCFVP